MPTELVILSGTFLTILFFLLGVPIVLCIATWVAFVSASSGDINALMNIGQTTFYGISSFALLAMPLFILTGDFIREGGIAKAFTDFARALFGIFRGALAIATLVASGLFSAISGSNSATTATIGSMMIPELKKEHYNEDFAAATAASGGTVGIIIPPSVIFIIYGVLLNVPVGDLFIAGIIPGVMMVIAMTMVAYIVARKNNWGLITKFSIRQVLRTAWASKHGFIASIVTLGGIYSGCFSPTEAAGVAVAYCAFAGLCLTRQIPVKNTFKVMGRSAEINGLLAPIIAFSVILQQQFTLLGVGEMVQSLLMGLGSEFLIIILMMVMIFAAGCIMESMPNVIIFAPILAPIAEQVGINSIHFGVIFVVGIAIGFITPPYGLNLFVASGITGIPYTRISRKIIWYVVALIIVWIVVALFPQISLTFLSEEHLQTLCCLF